jgi:DNA-binding transcriptional regulator YhcF (GntR family)
MLWRLDRANPSPLHEQLAACVRRAMADGSLPADERLPTARDLATVVSVNANTVLQAYRTLRAEGLVEFRRGRGVRVAGDAAARASVTDAARQLLETARRHGYTKPELIELIAGLQPEASR